MPALMPSPARECGDCSGVMLFEGMLVYCRNCGRSVCDGCSRKRHYRNPAGRWGCFTGPVEPNTVR